MCTTAREIASNAVTADKINVTSLSAISANIGNINGGSLNLGNGRFTVDNNGRVSISAASGNVGLKMTNDKIQFFNERGVLIVELSM